MKWAANDCQAAVDSDSDEIAATAKDGSQIRSILLQLRLRFDLSCRRIGLDDSTSHRAMEVLSS
ncbi:MAG: hypothetical protein ABIK79_09875 [Chloroflexota bacterium]|nr:hypothetical protein [Anaerolineae bacterium]